MLVRAAVVLMTGAAAVLAAIGPGEAAQPRPPVGAVAVIGDFGSEQPAQRAVADLVSRANPVAVVSAGDNVYESDDYDSIVGDYYGRWVDRGLFLPAAGNHDYSEGIESFDAYFDYLGGRRVYSRVVGGIEFFVLDSQAALDSARELRRQYTWLRVNVPRSKARWQVVVLHHPPYSSGEVHGSTPAVQWPFGWWGVDLVVSGHEHHYERLTVRGTTYVVDGAGGKDLYSFGTPLPGSRIRVDDRFGALFLTTASGRLAGEFWSTDGRLLDRFTVPR